MISILALILPSNEEFQVQVHKYLANNISKHFLIFRQH